MSFCAPSQPLPYAVVVVHVNLGRRRFDSTMLEPGDDESDYLTRSWHYHIPDALQESIRLGQLVWVPFGAQYVQGLVVGFDSTCPVGYEKDIDQIVYDEPLLSAEHLQLAQWMSQHYLVPLHRALLSMLPPGITQKAAMAYRLTPEVAVIAETEPQNDVLELLSTNEALSATGIAQALGKRNVQNLLNQMAGLGWIARQVRIEPPKVRPRLVPVYRLSSIDDLQDQVSTQATKQRQVLTYLDGRHEEGVVWVPREEITRETVCSTDTLNTLVEKGLILTEQRRIWRDPLPKSFVPVIPPKLTADQEVVWQALLANLDSNEGCTFLLQGITGSGKTEIYLRAVAHMLQSGRGAIVLVPEIALTPQTIRRFGARFPETIAVIHSRLSAGERYDQWERIRSGELRLVVGSRSALFTPVQKLGLIVLDEEHEWSYKQEQMPRYHARDVAVELAQITGATCILGSATPALESAYRAERGEYHRLTLPQRIVGHRGAIETQKRGRESLSYHMLDGEDDVTLFAELPPVQVVDMRAELRQGNTSIFSEPLREGIQHALDAEEQIILFLNRRGSATFVMCRDCGHVLNCPRCEVPLTYHASHQDLMCHHCSYHTPSPDRCPICSSRRIRFFGAGTQKVEQVVEQDWPSARIVRWDLDTTGGKDRHEEILDAFIHGQADIMIGTQMIAKGLDLPRVTLVGVIAADITLNLPDFRAGERTFQLLTQVAGRAGRSILGGRVILQTYNPQHPVIMAASAHDYAAFYEREMAFRQEHWYPPFSQLIQLTYVHPSEREAHEEAARMYEILSLRLRQMGLPEVDLIGPAPCFFRALRGKARWQILLRGTEPTALIADLPLPLGWRIDVDPVSLL